jgi:hypothetical protein
MLIQLDNILQVSKYHIIFDAKIPFLGDEAFKIDYTGVDVEIEGEILSNAAERQLMYCMNKDFGEALFDPEQVKNVFGTGKQYKITMYDKEN